MFWYLKTFPDSLVKLWESKSWVMTSQKLIPTVKPYHNVPCILKFCKIKIVITLQDNAVRGTPVQGGYREWRLFVTYWISLFYKLRCKRCIARVWNLLQKQRVEFQIYRKKGVFYCCHVDRRRDIFKWLFKRMSRLPSVARHDSNIELFTQLLFWGMEMQNNRDSRIKVKFDRGKVWY